MIISAHAGPNDGPESSYKTRPALYSLVQIVFDKEEKKGQPFVHQSTPYDGPWLSKIEKKARKEKKKQPDICPASGGRYYWTLRLI